MMNFNYECPYCWKEYEADMERDNIIFKTECENCGRSFKVNAYLDITVLIEED